MKKRVVIIGVKCCFTFMILCDGRFDVFPVVVFIWYLYTTVDSRLGFFLLILRLR